jgi:hypothetical protein
LEAAPESAEFRAVWSDNDFDIEDNTYKLRSEIGYGRQNTEIIVKKFREKTGNWNTAAQKCFDLTCNGFDDWFLPNQSELDLMFGNLKRLNYGDFKDENYWCSNEWGFNNNNAFCQNFKTGKTGNEFKRTIYHVRPVRRF